VKPYTELARKIQQQSTDSIENGSPNSYGNPSIALAFSTITSIPPFLSTLEEPVLPPSSLEAFQADIKTELCALREVIQVFGVDIQLQHHQLTKELTQQQETF
jgi:hypothetical protein